MKPPTKRQRDDPSFMIKYDVAVIVQSVRAQKERGLYAQTHPRVNDTDEVGQEIVPSSDFLPKFTSTLKYYRNKVDDALYFSVLLRVGQQLLQLHEWTAAANICFKPTQLELGADTSEVTVSRLAQHVQATFGRLTCAAEYARTSDPLVQTPSTLQTFLQYFLGVQRAMEAVTARSEEDREALYWLVYNGTVLIYKYAEPLVTLGFAAKVIPFLNWCILAFEATPNLCTCRFLRWRLRLFGIIARALEMQGSTSAGLKAMNRAMDSIEQLQQEKNMDPPVTPGDQALLNDCREQGCVLQFKFESTTDTAGCIAKLSERFADTKEVQVRACIHALVSPKQRVLQHAPPAEDSAERINALLEHIHTVLRPFTDQTTQLLQALQRRLNPSPDPLKSRRRRVDPFASDDLQLEYTDMNGLGGGLTTTGGAGKTTIPSGDTLGHALFTGPALDDWWAVIESGDGFDDTGSIPPLPLGDDEADQGGPGDPDSLLGVFEEHPEGGQLLPLELHVSLVQLLFHYERWDQFVALLHPLEVRLYFALKQVSLGLTPSSFKDRYEQPIIPAAAVASKDATDEEAEAAAADAGKPLTGAVNPFEGTRTAAGVKARRAVTFELGGITLGGATLERTGAGNPQADGADGEDDPLQVTVAMGPTGGPELRVQDGPGTYGIPTGPKQGAWLRRRTGLGVSGNDGEDDLDSATTVRIMLQQISVLRVAFELEFGDVPPLPPPPPLAPAKTEQDEEEEVPDTSRSKGKDKGGKSKDKGKDKDKAKAKGGKGKDKEPMEPVADLEAADIQASVDDYIPRPFTKVAGLAVSAEQLTAAVDVLEGCTDPDVAVMCTAGVAADMVVDFTLILYSHAEAMFNWLDKNDPGKVRQRTSKMAVEELLLQCMTTVHSAATMTDMDDAALRGTIALRLGRLLLDSGEHRSAVEALREGVAGLQAARDQLVNHSLHLPRRSDDQQALTAAAVSCYFDNPLEEKLSQRPGVGAYGGTGLFGAGSQARLQDNSLACLHADLISTLFEAELALSAMLQGRIALSRPPRSGNPAHGGHGSATATRGDALDGPSSRNPSRRSSLGDAKGVRVVEAMDDDGDAAAPLLERTKVRLGYIPGGVGAPYLPSKSTEARLMAECGSNYAWQVLLLLQLARYRPPATRARQELLQDAAKAMTLATDQITALQQVQHSQAEAAAEASYSTALGCRADVGTVNPNRVTDNRCAAPRLLARGASFIAVAPSALPYAFTEPVGTRRQRSRIAKYRMYAKPKGSGTDVALTCTDLVNTGEDLIAHRRNPNVPASEEADADVEVHRLFASVQGLTPNMVYVFACAAFDAEGNMLGDSIGATSSPVLAASPLPLMQLWAYLALEARRESMLVLARMCASMVARRWVAVGPMRPTHMRLPSQTLVLRQAEVDRAPVQLISLLVRCLFILAETGEGGAAQDRGRGRLPGEVIPLPKMDADEEDEAEDAGAEESDEASTQQPAVSGVLRLMDDKGDNESSNTLPLAKLLGDSGHGTTWVWEGPWSSSEEAELRQYSEVVRAQLAAIRRVQSMALATQAASAIRDPTLVMQAAAGTYTMARPLLVWKRKPASLLHALVQVHMALQLLPPHAWNPATAATFARVAYELNTAAQQCDEALMLDTAFKQLGVGSGPEPAIPAAGARSAYAPHAVVEYKSADGASSSQQDEEADAGNAARAKDAAAESSQDQSQSSSKYRSRWVPAAGGGWYNPWVVDAKDPPHVRTNKLEVYGTAFGMLTAEIDALQGSEQEAFVEFMLASPAWAEANLASLVDSGSENTTEATPSDPNDVFDSSPHGILRSLAGLADDWKRDELIAEEQKRLQAAEDHIREEKEAHEAAVAAAGADGADQVPPAVDETIPDAPPDHGGEGTLSFLKTRQHRRTHARALTEVWAATLKSPTAAVEMLRTKYADSEWLPELLCRVCAATLHLNRTGSVEEAIEAQKASAAAAAEAEERARQGEPVTPEGEETNSTVAHVALTIARWIRSFIPLIVRTATPGDEAAPADGSHDNTANEATVVSLGRLPTYVRRVLLAEQYQGVEGDEEEGVGSAMTRVYSTDVLPADVGIGRRPGTPRAGAGGGGFSRPDSPSGNSAVEPDSMGGGDEESPTWHVFTTADTGAVSVDDRRALLWLAELAFVESVAWQARLLSVATVTAESHPIYSGAGPAHSIELELELLPAADLGAVPPAEAARNAVQRVLDTALKQPAAGAGDEAGDGTGSPTEPTSPSTPSEPKSQSVAGLQLSAMPNARDTIALAQATMDASARAAVRARGALAWVAMRNSLRILWNTLRSAWIAPHAFGAYAAEVAGRGTEPDPQASAAAAAANEEGASPAEAAAESAPEESSGPESAEPAAAQFHWAPLWRASLCILDLFEAVGRDKVERLWARGLEPGYGQGRGGLRQTADPNAAEDADSEDGDVDDASEGDVAEAGMDFGTCLPRGMTSDDFVWMIQLLLYTGQALCYAQQWRTVLSLADRLHQLFPHSFISLDTGLPGQSVKKDPISGAVLVQSDDPDADAGGIKFAADARTLAGAAADSASILYALRRAFGAAALDAGSGLFKEGEDPTEARVREGLGGGLAGMFADDQIWGSAAVGAVGAVGGGDDQIDNDRTGWHNLHALSQLLRVQLYDSSLLNVAAPVGGLIADDAAASLLPLAVHAAEQLWQVTARHRRWCEAAITTFDEEYKALTSGPVKKRRKKATLVAQEAKLSAQQAAYLAGKQMLDAVLSEHAHREERAKSKMMMMKQRLEDRQRDLAVGRTALADSRALLGRHLASRVFQDQHLQSLANETRDSEGFAQRLVSAPALATAKKQGAAPPAPPGATAGGEMTVYRKAIDHFDTPVARVEGSYRRTIQLLRKRQERPLLCQALQDLAKFYASQGSSHMPQALRTWQDAVDASFSTLDAVQNWQAVLTNLSPDPLAALGVHGILLPAVALCRIARHGLVGKEDVRTLHHRFAAALFKAMFDASAQHPRRAIDFGRYQALELVPGVDELADARVVTAEDLLFATRECIAGLLSHGSTFVEEALPAIALYEYLARYRLASVQRTVDARLLRARALTIPGDLTGAARVIEALVRGLDMPHTGVARSSSATPLPPPATTEAGEDAAAHKDDAASGDKLDLTRASELPEVWWTEGVPMPRYYNHLPSSHPLNRACLYWVADPAVGLPVPLGLLLGDLLCARLGLVRAEFLHAASGGLHANVPTMPRGVWGDWEHRHMFNAAKDVKPAAPPAEPEDAAAAKGNGKGKDAAPEAPVVSEPLQPSGPLEFDGSLDGVVELSAEAKTWGGGTGWSLRSACIAAADAFCKDVYNRFDPDAKVVAPPSASTSQRSSAHGKAKGSARASARSRSPRDGRVLAKGKGKSKGKGKGVEFDQNSARSAAFVSPRTSTRAQLFVEELELLVAAQWRLGEGKTILGQHRRALADWAEAKRFFARLSGARAWRKLGKPRGQQPAGEGGADAADAATSAGVNVMGESQVVLEGSRRLGQPLSAVDWLRLRERIARALMLVRCTPAAVGVLERGLREAHGLEASLVGHRLLLARAEAAVALGDDATAGAAIGIVCSKGQQRAMAQARPSGGDPDSAVTAAALLAKVLLERQNAGAQLDAAREQLVQERREEVARLKRRGILVPDDATESESKDDGSKGGATASSVLRRVTAQDVADMERAFADMLTRHTELLRTAEALLRRRAVAIGCRMWYIDGDVVKDSDPDAADKLNDLTGQAAAAVAGTVGGDNSVGRTRSAPIRTFASFVPGGEEFTPITPCPPTAALDSLYLPYLDSLAATRYQLGRVLLEVGGIAMDRAVAQCRVDEAELRRQHAEALAKDRMVATLVLESDDDDASPTDETAGSGTGDGDKATEATAEGEAVEAAIHTQYQQQLHNRESMALLGAALRTLEKARGVLRHVHKPSVRLLAQTLWGVGRARRQLLSALRPTGQLQLLGIAADFTEQERVHRGIMYLPPAADDQAQQTVRLLPYHAFNVATVPLALSVELSRAGGAHDYGLMGKALLDLALAHGALAVEGFEKAHAVAARGYTRLGGAVAQLSRAAVGFAAQELQQESLSADAAAVCTAAIVDEVAATAVYDLNVARTAHAVGRGDDAVQQEPFGPMTGPEVDKALSTRSLLAYMQSNKYNAESVLSGVRVEAALCVSEAAFADAARAHESLVQTVPAYAAKLSVAVSDNPELAVSAGTLAHTDNATGSSPHLQIWIPTSVFNPVSVPQQPAPALLGSVGQPPLAWLDSTVPAPGADLLSPALTDSNKVLHQRAADALTAESPLPLGYSALLWRVCNGDDSLDVARNSTAASTVAEPQLGTAVRAVNAAATDVVLGNPVGMLPKDRLLFTCALGPVAARDEEAEGRPDRLADGSVLSQAAWASFVVSTNSVVLVQRLFAAAAHQLKAALRSSGIAQEVEGRGRKWNTEYVPEHLATLRAEATGSFKTAVAQARAILQSSSADESDDEQAARRTAVSKLVAAAIEEAANGGGGKGGKAAAKKPPAKKGGKGAAAPVEEEAPAIVYGTDDSLAMVEDPADLAKRAVALAAAFDVRFGGVVEDTTVCAWLRDVLRV